MKAPTRIIIIVLRLIVGASPQPDVDNEEFEHEGAEITARASPATQELLTAEGAEGC